MGLFRKRETTVDDTISDVLLRALVGNETITREKALTLPAVSAAVDFIASSIASMPVRLHRYKGGRIERIDNDPRVQMLNGDTGDTLNGYEMRKAAVIDYLCGQGGYIYIAKQGNNVTSLHYVDERYITIERFYHPIYKEYKIYVSGYSDGKKNAGTYEGWQFIKLLRNTKDGASGTGVVEEVSTALQAAYETLLYQLGLVKTGGNKRGFLKSKAKLDAQSIEALKTAWNRLYNNDSEDVVILNNGLEFQEASRSSVEMQLNESKRTLQDEINNIFHIYPNDFDRTFKEAIYPVVRAFETALNTTLLLEKEKGKKYFTFDVKEIIKASLKERYEAYDLAKRTGFITLNEIRDFEDMDYIEGLDVINVGLGAVLYDTNTHVYYTPNTDTVSDPNDKKEEDMLLGHVEAEEFDASGNSSDA